MLVLPQTKNLYLYHSVGCQKSLNIPKGRSEVVNRQQTRTDNTMTERIKETDKQSTKQTSKDVPTRSPQKQGKTRHVN